MKPSQIYQAPFNRLLSIYTLSPECHRAMEEFPTNVPEEKNIRVSVREHFFWTEDSERIVQVASAWLDDQPVMILRCAGRGGCDEYDRFITDEPRFREMLRYLQELSGPKLPSWDSDVVEPDQELLELNELYGHDLRMAMDIMEPVKKDPNYVNFGEVARGQIHEQCQYASRYVDGRHGFPKLNEGLRILGNPKDYHALTIHADDVPEFVRRVKEHLAGDTSQLPSDALAKGPKQS